jgi:hypothetical protein
MLANLCIQRLAQLGGSFCIFIIDSRHVQVPPKLVVTLVTPSLSCERTVQDKSTTSTRLTLRNCRTQLLILDITMKARPAISSLTNNSTPSLFTDYTMVQQGIISTPQVRRKETMQLRTLDTPMKESPDTSMPRLHVVFCHCIDSTVVKGLTTSIPCLLPKPTMQVTA